MKLEQMPSLEPSYLEDLLEKYSQSYPVAKPFPHVVIDNFFSDPSILEKILEEFPDPKGVNWQKFKNSNEKKLATTSELQMGENTRGLLYYLNSSTFITFIEQLTGISGILPDPHFVGGGLHQIEKGGYLKVHADFNRHSRLQLDRRLNILIYLNKDWLEEYGGYLELWDEKMTGCQKKILPIFNRCVVFSTTDFSYHGHPEPLTCPEGRTRKSLALYYYSNGRPASEVSEPHSTLFRSRPGQDLTEENQEYTLAVLMKKLVPPILLDLKNTLKRIK